MIQENLLVQANQKRLKHYLRDKHTAFSFFRFQLKDYYNIHQLHEQYPFIPKLEDYAGEIGYVRMECELVLVRNRLIDLEKYLLSLKNYDLMMTYTIPVYIPIFNYKLNINREGDVGTEHLKDKNDYQQAYRNNLENYSFIFVEAIQQRIYQRNMYDETGWGIPVFGDSFYKTLNSRFEEKWKKANEKQTIIDALFKGLSANDVYDFMYQFDFSKLPKCSDFNQFIKIYDVKSFNWLNKKDIYFLQNESINKDFQQRFMSIVRRNFDMSWLAPVLNKELKKS